MKRLMGVVALVVTGAVLVAPTVPAQAIVGGTPDEGEHPYVGELLYYLPDGLDPRFDDPGGWLKCSGWLLDADTVVTAGHCTYSVGTEGERAADPLRGGTDVWFTVDEEADFSVLPPSGPFIPDRNAERYDAYAAALDASSSWAEAATTYTHPQFDPARPELFDLGVVELSEPIVLDEYGSLPSQDYLEQYDGKNKKNALFETVGYGLQDSGPKGGGGGDTRRKVDQRLVSLNGARGLKGVAAVFSHSKGSTCFVDSGGPTIDISTPAAAAANVVVAVTSFGQNQNCNAGGSYRLDQADDLAFLADPAGSS